MSEDSPAGVVMETVEPLRRWRVRVRGVRAGARGADRPGRARPGRPGRQGRRHGGLRAARARARHRRRAQRVDCLGQRGHSWGAPDWSKIALARTLTAWMDTETAVSVSAVRPASAKHHADEAVAADAHHRRRAGRGRRAARQHDLRRATDASATPASSCGSTTRAASPTARPARCCAGRRSTSGACGWTRVLRLAHGGPHRRRPLRRAAAGRRLTRIEAVISDFGGVLTTPLFNAFAHVQEEHGIPLEALGKAMWRATQERRGEPAVPARARRAVRAGVPGHPPGRPGRGDRPRGRDARLRRALLRPAASERRDGRLPARPPGRPRRPAGDAHEQRPRVGAALARDAPRHRRDVRGHRRQRVRRHAQARPRDLPADARPPRAHRRRRASSSTTSSSTATRPATSACTRSTSRTPRRRPRRSRRS